MDFGSVFLISPSKAENDDTSPPPPSASGQSQAGANVAELVVAPESCAIRGKKGIHSAKDPPAMHITDLTTVWSFPVWRYLCMYLCTVATIIRCRDFEERSNYYDALLATESSTISGKKGIRSANHQQRKQKTSCHFFVKSLLAVVEHVLSGHVDPKGYMDHCLFLFWC
uniref:Uncharacterized protein n=1 Tax=Ananas comosus var. bracteatus TaxID=296719 RepID=A0A6V7QTU4_ANACO